MNDCTYLMTLGRTVLTSIEAVGGYDLYDAPDPIFECTVSYAATKLSIARQTIRNTLSLYKDKFDVLEHPYRSNGERIISPRDYQTLKAMFPRRKRPKGWLSRGK